MNNRCAVGLIGCGNWGQHILRDLVSLGCDVAVVALGETSWQRAAQGGAIAILPKVSDLPAVDGIVVATPTSTHADIIDSLLDRQVPIFTEKPLCDNPGRAADLARRAPDRLFVMDKWRYHPGIEMLANLARSGELGPVQGLQSKRHQWGNPHHDVDGVWILAPHELSIALEILGLIPKPRAAVAEREGEFLLSLTALLGEDPWWAMEVSTRVPDTRREIRLHCRDGVAVLDDGWNDYVRVIRTTDRRNASDRIEEKRPISAELPLWRELRAFIDHLRGGPAPKSSAAEGAAMIATLAKLREMAAVGTPRVTHAA